VNTASSCINTTDAFGAALCQQFGGPQGRFIAALTADAGDELMRPGSVSASNRRCSVAAVSA
jgi:hypothetical protein